MNKYTLILVSLLFSIIILSGCIDSVPAKEPLTITLIRNSDPLSSSFNQISVIHDDEANVTCWVLLESGISCIPDSQLK